MGISYTSGNMVPTNMIGTFNGLTTKKRYSTANDSATYTCPAGKQWIIVQAFTQGVNYSALVRHQTAGASTLQDIASCTDGNFDSKMYNGYIIAAGEKILIHNTGGFIYYEVAV